MGFIKKIHLENFQSHKDTELYFDDGLTVILGQTDQGKSAIIRALKWVLYNEPRGADFITVGCKLCRVTIEMDDGTVITRERDGQKNRYILIKDGEEQIFEGFGYNVPLEIIKAHGIPKIYIDRDSTSAVNLAEQLEGPFLISESGSNRAKALGRLVGVHIIDAAQRSTIKDLLDADQRRKQVEKEIEDIKEDLKSYQDIDLILEKISELKSLLADLKGKTNIFTKLNSIKENIEPTEENIKNTYILLKKTGFISDVKKYVLIADNLFSEHQILKRTKEKISEVDNFIKIERGNILKTAHIPQAEKDYEIIKELYEKLTKIIQVKNKLISTERTLEVNTSVLKKTEKIFSADKLSEQIALTTDILKKHKLLLNQWHQLEQEIKAHTEELKKYEKAAMTDKYMENLEGKIQRIKDYKNLSKSIYQVDTAINKGEIYLKNLSDNIHSMAMDYSLLLKKFSRCPTCLSPIDKETTDRIVMDMIKA